MANILKSEVLKSFKNLHKARKNVFNGDINALQSCRNKINEEFKKNKNVSDTSAISELIKYANSVEYELKSTVIQAKEVEPGKYQLRIMPDTVKLVNVSFKE